MPLLGNACNNPVQVTCPGKPAQGMGPMLHPAQGDHVFGDIAGVIRTGLMSIIGGGRMWGGDDGYPGRFGSDVYDPKTNLLHPLKTYLWQRALAQWVTFRTLDLGHTDNAPVVRRNPNVYEPDNHSLMYGGYAARFQWELCEIGYNDGVNFSIGSTSPRQGMNWVGRVMASFNTMMEFIADKTALTAYMAGLSVRQIQSNANLAPHTAISLAAVRKQIISLSNHQVGDQINRIRQICDNFDNARFALKQMLEAMQYINIYWDNNQGHWYSFD